jgi:hypothetical protein
MRSAETLDILKVWTLDSRAFRIKSSTSFRDLEFQFQHLGFLDFECGLA